MKRTFGNKGRRLRPVGGANVGNYWTEWKWAVCVFIDSLCRELLYDVEGVHHILYYGKDNIFPPKVL